MKLIRKPRNLLILGCFLLCPIVSQAEETGSFQAAFENKIKGSAQGFELGAVNEVEKDFNGFQLGLLTNVTKRSFEGFQAALLYNDAGEDIHGLQLGLVNHTGSLDGIQIGILNFNDDTRYLGFFPFINAAF